jgi:hypothetical protein
LEHSNRALAFERGMRSERAGREGERS